MSDRRLLVVQPSADYAQRVCSQFPGALLVTTPERARQLVGFDVVAADLEQPASALEALRSQLRRRGAQPGGITCFVCEHLAVTAFLAERLALPFHSPALVRDTRSKARSAAIWQAHGVLVPATSVVRSEAEVEAFARRRPPPWIVKPLDGSGSEWVTRADTVDALLAAHRALVEGLAAARNVAPAGIEHLVQTFASGREFGADLLVAGDQITVARLTEKRLRADGPLAGMVEAYFFPALAAAEREALTTALRAALRALGVRRGLVMADVVLTAAGPVLLEVALRPGGDCLPDLCVHAIGYDPVRTACRLALELAPDRAPADPRQPVAALHLLSDRAGTIRRIDCARLLADPRVVRVIEVYHGPGDTLRLWAGSYDDRILAAVLVTYEDPADLPAMSRQLAQAVDVEFEP